MGTSLAITASLFTQPGFAVAGEITVSAGDWVSFMPSESLDSRSSAAQMEVLCKNTTESHRHFTSLGVPGAAFSSEEQHSLGLRVLCESGFGCKQP